MESYFKKKTYFSDERSKCRSFYLLALLIVANILSWVIAFIAFRDNTMLLGLAFLAYSFGLKHAVDADHIAAIDNVTRKLMQQGKIPISVGTFFSLGHSTVVIIASILLAGAALAFKENISTYQSVGGIIGTMVSSLFLLLFGLINCVILLSIYKKFRAIKQGTVFSSEELNDVGVNNGGIICKVFGRFFNLVNKSWHMYFVGFLFGLGFDTATEVGVLGISAVSASSGMEPWLILLFPLLFAVGMALIDTLDNFVMIGAYGWAFSKPIRKLYYNITITAASVIVALFIGSIEGLGLISEKLELNGWFWNVINNISESFETLGFWIVGLFIGCWAISVFNYYIRGYDNLLVNK